MKPLDIRTLPLDGTVCIEASAGTGKTYTIALIVLRLVMETALDLRSLVVVTFTESATGELAERVAAFLRLAREYALNGIRTREDENIAALVDAAREGAGDKVLTRLDDALLNLDLARISTIHGFCKRVLDDFAFETKSSFGTGLIANRDDLAEEILADFWRREIVPLDPLLYSLVADVNPGSLRSELGRFLSFPGLQVDGPAVDQKLIDGFLRDFDSLATLWAGSKQKILEMLNEPKRFKTKAYEPTDENLRRIARRLDACFDKSLPDLEAIRSISHSTLDALIYVPAKKAGFALPNIPIFKNADAFLEKYGPLREELPAALKKRAYDYLTTELNIRQKTLHVRSFDNMISDLASALNVGGEATASVIRKQFAAVLVDEFQDTDPLQYDIFRQLFHGQEGIFFAVIGDPKQAIYRFRGGDIDTYVRARKDVHPSRRFTIDNNYRSEARLVAAINKIYEIENPLFDGNGPFLDREIEYITVSAKRDLLPPEQDGEVVPPVILWNVADGERVDERIVGRRIADAIARFMDPRHPLVLGSAKKRRPLSLGDIAILVGSHRTAALFKSILGQFGIRSVIGKSGSILQSDEADVVTVLLEAILNPSREKVVRALLVSKLYGYDIDGLTAWEASDTDRIATLDALNSSRSRWLKEGVASALNAMLSRSRAYSLADDGDGGLLNERRITNLRHLIELLHTEELRIGRNPERLMSSYLRLRAEAGQGSAEEMEQRLESDYDAVQINTMHKAKGLQWPVVFVPELCWDGVFANSANVAPIFSDGKQRKADLDPAQFDEILQKVRAETRQERMRLAYVTLTRAESLLVAVTADRSEEGAPDLSPAALLLRSPQLRKMKDRKGPLVLAGDLTPVEKPGKPQVQVLRGQLRSVSKWDTAHRIAPGWSIGSYTSLVREAVQERFETESDPVPAEGIFAFPRGPEAGTALHSIFEKVDFADAGRPGAPRNPDVTRVIEGVLTDTGFHTRRESEWVGPVTEMVRQVLHAPISSVGDGFKLVSLGRDERIAELEFNLAAAHPDLGKPPVTEKSLTGVLGPDIGHVAKGRQLAGFLNGYIDLVFRHKGRWWILDWKSNHLGNSAARYDHAALERAMSDHNYHLQYHLYTVALVRYLRVASGGTFDYEREFGGVLYLFVRGIDGTGNGIYHARPGREIIARLEEML
jgi:exodeoxyribonuclease V beta subunit